MPDKTAAKKPTRPQRRTYAILRATGDNWQVLGEADGANDKQAIANLLTGSDDQPQEGVFVAIPARNFRPVTRKLETVTKALWP